MKKRYYVGKRADKLQGEVFTSATTPTAEDFPQYGYTTGPFRTKVGATWAAQYGACFYSIREAERLAHAERNKTLREAEEFTRSQIRQAWANNTLD